jgi:hypothetical protein
MMMENLVEWRLAGETEVLGENLPQHRGGKPANNRGLLQSLKEPCMRPQMQHRIQIRKYVRTVGRTFWIHVLFHFVCFVDRNVHLSLTGICCSRADQTTGNTVSLHVLTVPAVLKQLWHNGGIIKRSRPLLGNGSTSYHGNGYARINRGTAGDGPWVPPCGGALEYLHRSPTSPRRRREWNSVTLLLRDIDTVTWSSILGPQRVWRLSEPSDSKLLLWVSRDLESRITVLARTSSSLAGRQSVSRGVVNDG